MPAAIATQKECLAGARYMRSEFGAAFFSNR